MQDIANQPTCYLDREESIRRLPQLVFAASEAWRRGGGEAQLGMAAFPKAVGARCSLCSFALSGEELLVLSQFAGANENSAMLRRLRGGQCAREGCDSQHYHLLFYEVPPLSWATLFAESRAKDVAQSELEPTPVPTAAPALPVQRKLWTPSRTQVRITATAVICLLAWMGWRWYNGQTIPLLRQPEHFHVTPGPDAIRPR
jgi:hypothetical protein